MIFFSFSLSEEFTVAKVPFNRPSEEALFYMTDISVLQQKSVYILGNVDLQNIYCASFFSGSWLIRHLTMLSTINLYDLVKNEFSFENEVDLLPSCKESSD